MSTKAIEEVLGLTPCLCSDRSCVVCRARAELEKIRKAAVVFLGEDIPNVLPRDEAKAAWAVVQVIAEEAP